MTYEQAMTFLLASIAPDSGHHFHLRQALEIVLAGKPTMAEQRAIDAHAAQVRAERRLSHADHHMDDKRIVGELLAARAAADGVELAEDQRIVNELMAARHQADVAMHTASAGLTAAEHKASHDHAVAADVDHAARAAANKKAADEIVAEHKK